MWAGVGSDADMRPAGSCGTHTCHPRQFSSSPSAADGSDRPFRCNDRSRPSEKPKRIIRPRAFFHRAGNTFPEITSGSPGSFSGGITVFHERFSGAMQEPQGAPHLRLKDKRPSFPAPQRSQAECAAGSGKNGSMLSAENSLSPAYDRRLAFATAIVFRKGCSRERCCLS